MNVPVAANVPARKTTCRAHRFVNVVTAATQQITV